MGLSVVDVSPLLYSKAPTNSLSIYGRVTWHGDLLATRVEWRLLFLLKTDGTVDSERRGRSLRWHPHLGSGTERKAWKAGVGFYGLCGNEDSMLQLVSINGV